MKDFPSCFGENGVQVADFSSSNANKAAQNLVTCVYQCRIRGKSCSITITWSKNLMGQGLNVEIDNNTNQSLCKVDIKPWLFSKKKGSKSLESNCGNIDIYWDLSSAKFGSGPEPLEGFYVGCVFDKQIILLLGDMRKEASRKTGASLSPSSPICVSKREHIFGKKIFRTKARFCSKGRDHDLLIECDTISTNDPCLLIRIDSKPLMQVKRLRWKFRGNQTILVDGFDVEVFWDVHNWLFGTSLGSAVFMFKTEVGTEKLWADQSFCDSKIMQRFQSSQLQSLGSSLILHAWKNE